MARFLSTDPWAYKYPSWSTYNYVMGNPIMLIDPTGKGPEDANKGLQDGGYLILARAMMNSTVDREKRQNGYAMLYPISANSVNNAATYAGNYSINVAKAVGMPSNDDGTFRNAIRHTMWSAFSAKAVGSYHATLALNSHETHTNIDWNQRNFDELFEADHTIDLLNNMIGRKIAAQNEGASNNTLALKVLEYQRTNGLWVVEANKNGEGFKIVKKKISEEVYNLAVEEIKKKGEDGLNK